MTNKQAIHTLKKLQNKFLKFDQELKSVDFEKEITAFQMAIDALKKEEESKNAH